MSQDIVADQLENDKYPRVKALFDYVEGSDFGGEMRPLMQVPKPDAVANAIQQQQLTHPKS
jgi:hypothetical protein